ncbi:MAG TPA: hypothetical protein HPP76_06410 [Desulfuromonadales bacterium]|nr:hypothetical protein [Desulfuromonadales bacterium]
MPTFSKISISLATITSLILLTLPAETLAEQESTASKSGEPARMKPATEWSSQFTFGYLPSADLRERGDSAAIADYRLRAGRTIPVNSSTSLTIGGGYGLKSIDAPAAAALPGTLHSVVLETGVSYRINERSFANLKLFPGLYSDFKDLTGDDVKMPLLALGGYTFDNGLTLTGGFIYRFGYHSMQFLPILGVSYQPGPQWRIDIVAPRPGVTYMHSRNLNLFLAGDFASDEYGIHDSTVSAGALKYRDYKVLCGVEYLPAAGTKVAVSTGYAFDRSIEFYDSSRPSIRLDNVPFVKLSLDLAW